MAPEVHGDIEYFAEGDPHQLALGPPHLVVQAAQDAALRARVIVLDESALDAGRVREGAGVVAFVKEAALIAEDLGFEDQHVGEVARNDFHTFSPAILKRYCP
ncbi:hypothetical protein D3C78_515160 [compost metagenome]